MGGVVCESFTAAPHSFVVFYRLTRRKNFEILEGKNVLEC